MKKFHVIYGPRGQVHTVSDRGREYVAVWPDMLSALRYKSRHRELGSYWAVPLGRRLFEELLFDARGRALESGEIESGLYPETVIGGIYARLRGRAGESRAAAD